MSQDVAQKSVSVRGQSKLWLWRGAAAALLASAVGIGMVGVSGVAQEAAAPVGLAGVLPAETPAELTDLAGALPETWQTWAGELTAELGKLYATPGTIDEQRQTLAALKQRVSTLEVAILDYRYQAAKAKFSDLRGELLRRVSLAEAALAAIEKAPASKEAVTELVAAVETYESTGLKTDGKAAAEALTKAQAAAGDAGAGLAVAFRDGYHNYNLRVLVSEGFLNKVVAERRAENGIVDDCILGAKVDGCQTTWTNVGVDIMPSTGVAKLCLYAHGTISSNTQGVTEQATIHTIGNHSFRAEKPILFDGDKFSTEGAGVGVNANNTTVGATTIYDWIPLLGRFANQKAIQAATEKKPESEAIARGKITAQLLPRFNSEVDRKFGTGGELNGQLAPAMERLHNANLYPQTKSYYTTDSWLVGDARVAEAGELAGNTPVGGLATDGCYVQIHESFLNNAMDRALLAGRTFTEQELINEMTRQISLVVGKELTPPAVPKKEGGEDKSLTIMFDANDPVRFKALDGQLVVTVRAAFKQAGKDETIPPQAISIPLNLVIEGEKLKTTAGDISVRAVEKPANVAEQVARAGVIKGRFQEALIPREEDRAFFVDKDGVKLQLKVEEIVSADGWLTVRIR